MRFRSTIVMAACLAAALPLQGVAAASGAHTSARAPAAIFSPVIIEWFSTMHPHAGQSDVVFVRMLDGNKPVPGARLTAWLLLGKRALLSVHGTTTDSKGQAKASFKVPSTVAGKSVKVQAILTYKGEKYPGMNTLRVAG
jgi:hypothetical protein